MSKALEKKKKNIILEKVGFISTSHLYSSCSSDHQAKWMKFYIWIQQIPSESLPMYPIPIPTQETGTKSLVSHSPWSLANG